MSKYSYKKSYTGWWITGITIALVAGLFWWGNHSVSNQTNRQLALSCTTDMFTTFHIHPHLQILINGQQQDIPANIGITLACMHPIHTHDTSGTLHVESPEARDFTLADFFAVWDKTFNQNQILDNTIDDSHIIKVMVNGSQVDTYENTILRDKDQIVISYEAKQ
ncbi:MAG: hypothetical protein KGJ89_03075 [Patescibacteria group bacterium]|nr:hypothetical protein [Patescibacteria group bacterium]MDE2015467.1 hypothetical protein [Patescibacteria group bacterium]MDE2226917.1 hypothetical protein [Patescibacteria group bacterium]